MGDHIIEVRPYVFGRDAQRFQPLFTRPPIAPFISDWIIPEIVRHPVHFDDEGRSLAVEVENEWAKWMLPPKLESSRP